MASTITHAYFIMDVYDKLDTRLKSFLIDKKELLKTSAQCMDVLFFYNITKFNKGKRIRDFGEYFHDNNTEMWGEGTSQYSGRKQRDEQSKYPI